MAGIVVAAAATHTTTIAFYYYYFLSLRQTEIKIDQLHIDMIGQHPPTTNFSRVQNVDNILHAMPKENSDAIHSCFQF